MLVGSLRCLVGARRKGRASCLEGTIRFRLAKPNKLLLFRKCRIKKVGSSAKEKGQLRGKRVEGRMKSPKGIKTPLVSGTL